MPHVNTVRAELSGIVRSPHKVITDSITTIKACFSRKSSIEAHTGWPTGGGGGLLPGNQP